MEGKRISLTILEVCKKLGIDYCKDEKVLQLFQDAVRLGEIIRDLRIIAGDLEALADRHKIDGLKERLHKEALFIESIDHELFKLAKQLQEKND